MTKIELLSPAGNLEKLKTAIDFGADAVYMGGNKLNLRAFSDNFSNDKLVEGINYVHEKGKRAYIALNVFPHEEDFNELKEYLLFLESLKVDALIVSDPGIISVCKEIIPTVNLHLSTQMNTLNSRSIDFWYNQGIKRVVLARELSLNEIKSINKNTVNDSELEVFVHGSMCMSYSGRCLISNYMTGRDANRGSCAQPCRYKYRLVEEQRPNEYFEIQEDNKGTYIMNSKDLCMINYIKEIAEAGVSSLKIEGRMKSQYYVAVTTKCYREAIDKYYEDPNNYKVNPKWLEDLEKVSHRQYYTGFYFDKEESKQIYENSSYIKTHNIVGIVKSYDKNNKRVVVEQKNKVFEGDELEVLRPFGDNVKVKILDMKNSAMEKISDAPVAQMEYNFYSEEELFEKDILIKEI